MNRFTALALTSLVLAACEHDAPPQAQELTDTQQPEAIDDLAIVEKTLPEDTCSTLPAGPRRLVVPGYEHRPTLVNLPTGEGPHDAVVMLHAVGGNALSVAQNTRFHIRAAQRGMIAVFPSSAPKGSWRAGDAEGLTELTPEDDVGYLSAVADALADQLCVDRVFAVGFDRGGMMAQRWACEGTGVDAVASVAGPRLDHACDQEPVPALLVHGLDDQLMPYDGSTSPLTGQTWASAEDTTDAWLEHNGWNGEEPRLRKYGPYACETFRGDAFVTHCAVEGLPHVWPGGRATPDRPELDMTVQSLNWFARLPE